MVLDLCGMVWSAVVCMGPGAVLDWCGMVWLVVGLGVDDRR